MKVEVHTHGGETKVLEVEEFDALELEEKINNNNTIVVTIGGYIFSRIDIKNIFPIVEEGSEQENEEEDTEEENTDETENEDVEE